MNFQPWEDKYRPGQLKNMILPDSIRLNMEKYIEAGEIPNMVFSGPPGVGKTTLAKIIVRNIDADIKILNGSDKDDRGIGAISDIQKFANVASLKKWKIIFFDEGENLTPDAWKALKATTEKYIKRVRFIFATNHFHQVIPALRSRLAHFEFPRLEKEIIIDYYKKVLTNEKIKFIETDLEKVFKLNNGDLRQSLIYLQQNSLTGTLKLSMTDYTTIVKLVSSRDVKGLKKYFASNSVNWDSLYRYLYDITDDPKKLLVLGKYYISSSSVVDQEINFMTCICELP